MKYLFFAALAIIIASCTKIIDFNEESSENRLVLNSVIGPDEDFLATLSKGISILKDTGGVLPRLAGSIELYENGKSIGKVSSQSGVFRWGDFKPKEGQNYKLVAFSGGKQVEAETYIPESPVILKVDTVSETSQYGLSSKWYHLKFRDLPGDDYYRIVMKCTQLFRLTEKDKSVFVQKIYYNYSYSDDRVITDLYGSIGDDLIGSTPMNRHLIFDDHLFQGKEFTISLNSADIYNGYFYYYDYKTNSFYTYDDNNSELYAETNEVLLYKLTVDLFNYMKSYQLYNYMIYDPFSQPVTIYSNVKNGAGIFAGKSKPARYVFKKDYVPHSMDTIKVETNFSGF